MFRQLTAVLLTICTLLLCVSCAHSGDGENQETQSQTKAPTESSDPDSLFHTVKDDLPDTMDFGGETIRMILRSEERYCSEFMAEEAATNVVNDAIYSRNLGVEDRLNVTIELNNTNAGAQINGHGPWANISNSILSGVCIYDVAVGSAAPATNYALQGEYRNLRNVPNLNLDKEYWAQGMLENMTLAGATYFATGSISTYFYDSAYVVYFNRNLCNNWGIVPDSIYETVMNGEWTLEHMINLTKDIYSDTNGNGPDNEDVYGFGLQVTSATDGFYSSCDIAMTEILNDGNIQFAVDLDKLESVVTALSDFLWSSSGTVALCENENYEAADIYLLDQQFANDRLLFVTDWLYSTSTSTMKDMQSDYGVLPYPKFDAGQPSYQTYIHDKMSIVGIPITVSDARMEMVGAFVEAMASGGQNTVMPAYYEKALTGRYIRDPESVQTMDIIIRNVTNDRIWFLYNSVGADLLREQIWYKKNDLVSTYRTLYEETNTYLGTMYEAYEKYSGN